MPSLALTDLTIRSLKAERQTDFWDTKTPSFGIRVGPRTKTFVVKHQNARRTIGAYPELSLQEARRRALASKSETNGQRAAISFKHARTRYFEQGQWRPSTRREMERSLARFQWDKPLDKITHIDVAHAIEHIKARSEAAHALKYLATFFNWCVPRYVQFSPCTGLKPPTRYVPRDRLLTDDEIKRVWITAGQLGAYGNFVRLLITTGQRANQIVQLDNAWIKDDRITFPAAVMKGNREHVLLYGELTKPLLSLPRPLSYQGKRKLDLDRGSRVSNWVLHDIRRFYSSTHAKLRTPIDITEALLSHVSGSRSQIQRVYDLYDRIDEKRAAQRAYEQHLMALFSSP